MEFAAEKFETRLVVVFGHSDCGAIEATLEELQRPAETQSRNLRSIVDRIRPSVEGLLKSDLRSDPAAISRAAVRAHLRASVNTLRHGSEVLERMIERSGLQIVGAEYSPALHPQRTAQGSRPAGLDAWATSSRPWRAYAEAPE